MSPRFIPRDSGLEEILVEHAQLVETVAGLLGQMLGETRPGRTKIATQIADRELAGDELRQRLLQRLNSAMFTPADPEDLLGLSRAIDECLDRVDSGADLMSLLRLNDLPAGVNDQIAVLQRQAELTHAVVSGLRRSKDQAEYLAEINRLENQGGKLHRRMVAELLEEGAGVPGGLEEALKTREIIDRLEGVIDAFQNVAERVEIIAVKDN